MAEMAEMSKFTDWLSVHTFYISSDFIVCALYAHTDARAHGEQHTSTTRIFAYEKHMFRLLTIGMHWMVNVRIEWKRDNGDGIPWNPF